MKIKHFKFKSVQSTNNIAIKLIKDNKLKPTLISTDSQTKGRGTMGKKWVSKKGNVFISIFFEINQKKINFKQYALLNACILRLVISTLIKKKIKIKWPNDSMYNNDKICGILQEVLEFRGKKYLIIGIGINTLTSIINNKFKSITLSECTTREIKNIDILEDLKITYENFLNDMNKYKISYLEKKYLKGVR